MNRISLITGFVLLTLSHVLVGQSEDQKPVLRMGYFSHLLIQPGLSAGADFVLNQSSKREGQMLIIRPSLGGFTNPGNQYSLVLQTELGIRKISYRKERKRYRQIGLGLGYLQQYELLGLSVNLGDGSINNKPRDRRDYLLPTVHVEFGRMINTRLGWYTQLAAGAKIHNDRKPVTAVFVALGVQYQLGSKS